MSRYAYDSSYTGGVRVSTVKNDDGSVGIVTGTGKGGGTHIKVFEFDGSLLRNFFAEEPSDYMNGVWVGGNP